MNARDYKIFRPGCYYHVYNRGNNKEHIFLEGQDYMNFLKRLKVVLGIPVSKIPFGQRVSLTTRRSRLRIKPFPDRSFSILCYCLMPNHFHFLIKQNVNKGINELIQRVTTSYAKYFNLKYERVGNVFQDTFKAKIVDNDSYLVYLSAYIHNNPTNPENYEYSSFKDYLGSRDGQITDKDFVLSFFENDSQKYKKFVLDYSESKYQAIKHLTF